MIAGGLSASVCSVSSLAKISREATRSWGFLLSVREDLPFDSDAIVNSDISTISSCTSPCTSSCGKPADKLGVVSVSCWRIAVVLDNSVSNSFWRALNASSRALDSCKELVILFSDCSSFWCASVSARSRARIVDWDVANSDCNAFTWSTKVLFSCSRRAFCCASFSLLSLNWLISSWKARWIASISRFFACNAISFSLICWLLQASNFSYANWDRSAIPLPHATTSSYWASFSAPMAVNDALSCAICSSRCVISARRESIISGSTFNWLISATGAPDCVLLGSAITSASASASASASQLVLSHSSSESPSRLPRTTDSCLLAPVSVSLVTGLLKGCAVFAVEAI